MYERGYGSKYHATQGGGKYLPASAIAKLMRADIKAAVKAGELPDVKYSVTVSNYAGGRSINIAIQDLPNAWVKGTDRYGYERDVLTPEAQAVEDKVKAIHWAYNYDGSDSMVDYFDVNYYGHVEVESPWHAEFRAEEKARQEAKKEAAKNAPPPEPVVLKYAPKCDVTQGYYKTPACSEPATVMQRSKSRWVLDHPRCAAHARGKTRPIVVEAAA